MASIPPFSLIGVVLGLLIFGSSISLISFMAIIALGGGIVVNNGIILIDAINVLREEHANEGEENLEDLRMSVANGGGASRLRPILMTTLTTMLGGVIPMALATGGRGGQPSMPPHLDKPLQEDCLVPP